MLFSNLSVLTKHSSKFPLKKIVFKIF